MSENLEIKLEEAANVLYSQFEALYAIDEHAALKRVSGIVLHLRDSAERTAINDNIRENYNMGLLSDEELKNSLIE